VLFENNNKLNECTFTVISTSQVFICNLTVMAAAGGCAGPRGVLGDTGDTGPVGDRGSTGVSGEVGYTGSPGRQGATGQLSILYTQSRTSWTQSYASADLLLCNYPRRLCRTFESVCSYLFVCQQHNSKRKILKCSDSETWYREWPLDILEVI